MPKIIALRFQYRQGLSPHKFETIPFYLKHLRGFLRRHLGKCIWIKGGVIEQPAYLVFTEDIKDDVVSLLSKPLEDLGRFAITPVKNPAELIRKYLNHQRVVLGYLELDSYQLGDPSTVAEEAQLDVDYRKGFWLNDEIFLRAEHAEEIVAGNEIWINFINVEEQHYDANGNLVFTERRPQLMIRKKYCKSSPETSCPLKT